MVFDNTVHILDHRSFGIHGARHTASRRGYVGSWWVEGWSKGKFLGFSGPTQKNWQAKPIQKKKLSTKKMMSQKCCFFRFLLQLFNFVFFPDGLQFWKISGWVMGGEDKKTTWQPVTGASYWYRSKTETPKKEERLLKKNQYFEDSFWVLFSSIRFAYRFKEKQISSFQHFSSSEIEESCGSWWDLIMGHVATGCIKNLPLNHVVGRIRVHPHPKKKNRKNGKKWKHLPQMNVENNDLFWQFDHHF